MRNGRDVTVNTVGQEDADPTDATIEWLSRKIDGPSSVLMKAPHVMIDRGVTQQHGSS
jgi:hypothetical protein